MLAVLLVVAGVLETPTSSDIVVDFSRVGAADEFKTPVFGSKRGGLGTIA